MASSQKQHKGVCIETCGNDGLLFFKDFPTQLVKVKLRDQNLALGKYLDANVTVLKSNELRLSNVYVNTSKFDFVKGTIRTYARVKIERAPMKYFPFSQIGQDDVFGEVLIPNAMFDIGQVLRVEIQYNDFFLDGIFWIATKYAKFYPDNPTRAEELRSFSTDLTIPEQTLFPKVNRPRTGGANRHNGRHQEDRNQSTSSNDQAGRPLESPNSEDHNQIARRAYDRRCILSFPAINTGNLSTHVNRDNETNHMLVLNTFKDYAVALVYPHSEKYGIISTTIQKYDELVKIGAILEVALDIIEQDCFYSYVARSIYECNSLNARVFPPNSERFIFTATMNGSDLFISDFSYESNPNEQFIRSTLGIVLFKEAALRKLVEFMRGNYYFSVQHIVHKRATWIAIDSKFYEYDDPTPTNSAQNSTNNVPQPTRNFQDNAPGFSMKF